MNLNTLPQNLQQAVVVRIKRAALLNALVEMVPSDTRWVNLFLNSLVFSYLKVGQAHSQRCQ